MVVIPFQPRFLHPDPVNSPSPSNPPGAWARPPGASGLPRRSGPGPVAPAPFLPRVRAFAVVALTAFGWLSWVAGVVGAEQPGPAGGGGLRVGAAAAILAA